MGEDADIATYKQRHKPHVAYIGTHAVNAKYKCRRCQRELPDVAYSPLPGLYSVGSMYYHLLHPFCKKCRKELKSRWKDHPRFSRALHDYFLKQFSGTKAGARARRIPVSIDVDDLIGLYLAQDGKCAVSGVKLNIGKKNPLVKDPTAASVDRIDSDGIYSLDNVQIVCLRINLMKSDMTPAEFIDWCRRIVRQHERKEAEDQFMKEEELLKAIG